MIKNSFIYGRTKGMVELRKLVCVKQVDLKLGTENFKILLGKNPRNIMKSLVHE